jgi:hypothetical protein
MCGRRALYLWTGFWDVGPGYLAMEPMDPANVPFATGMTLLGVMGLWLAWRKMPFEAIRYGGVLFIYPLMYYFIHPEAYRMRPLDPLLVILGCYAVVTLRGRAAEKAAAAVAWEAGEGIEVVAPA